MSHVIRNHPFSTPSWVGSCSLEPRYFDTRFRLEDLGFADKGLVFEIRDLRSSPFATFRSTLEPWKGLPKVSSPCKTASRKSHSSSFLWSRLYTVDFNPLIKKSTCLTQLKVGPYAKQIWSRYIKTNDSTKPSKSVVCRWVLTDCPRLDLKRRHTLARRMSF